VTYTKTWGKCGIFGSTERRFAGHEALKTPGPGQYESKVELATAATLISTKPSIEALTTTN